MDEAAAEREELDAWLQQPDRRALPGAGVHGGVARAGAWMLVDPKPNRYVHFGLLGKVVT